MNALLDLLAASPLLTIMIVVALGTLLGIVPFGPVKFGPAGALFVGLAVGALDPRFGQGLGLIQTLGLALFVYTVGLASGATFFSSLRRQLPLMLGSLVVLAIAAGTTIAIGGVLGLTSALQGGSFAGALTSTPTLAAATAKAGSDEPAVGYALTYPVGVVLTIVVVSVVLGRAWSCPKDPPPIAGQHLVDLTVEVLKPAPMRDVPGFAEHLVRFSYLCRDGEIRVVHPDERFETGDKVVIIGPADPVSAAVAFLGRQAETHLANDRTAVDYRRILISNPMIAGRTIASLDIPRRYDGIITRVRRGDTEFLAYDDLVVELGDRLRVVTPRARIKDVGHYLGDSERRVSEIDALSLGIGIAIGLAVGLIAITLPGGIRLSLGAAAGPLIVGMVLGRLERTGPIVWGLPNSANLTIRQLGLLLFLAATGLASGQAFASQAFTGQGLRIVVAGVVIVTVAATLMVLVGRLLGVSPVRAAGALCGFIGQPAILAFGNSKVDDERLGAGFTALFAIGMIAKILLVQIIVGL
jgi:putative transport protein